MQCLLNSNSKHPNIRFQNTKEQSMMITDPLPEKEAIKNHPTLPPWPVQLLISNHKSLKCNRLSQSVLFGVAFCLLKFKISSPKPVWVTLAQFGTFIHPSLEDDLNHL